MSFEDAKRVKHYLEKVVGVSSTPFETICPLPVLVVMGGITQSESEFKTRTSAVIDIFEVVNTQYRFDPNARVFPVAKLKGANPYSRMIIIGRTSNTDIQLPSSEISKMHAFITWQECGGKTYNIADGRSRNGTWLGDKKLPPQEVHKLESGAIIRVGHSMLLRFYLPDDFHRALRKMVNL